MIALVLLVIALTAGGCAVLATLRRNAADAAEQEEIDSWLADLRAVRS